MKRKWEGEAPAEPNHMSCFHAVNLVADVQQQGHAPGVSQQSLKSRRCPEVRSATLGCDVGPRCGRPEDSSRTISAGVFVSREVVGKSFLENEGQRIEACEMPFAHHADAVDPGW